MSPIFNQSFYLASNLDLGALTCHIFDAVPRREVTRRMIEAERSKSYSNGDARSTLPFPAMRRKLLNGAPRRYTWAISIRDHSVSPLIRRNFKRGYLTQAFQFPNDPISQRRRGCMRARMCTRLQLLQTPRILHIFGLVLHVLVRERDVSSQERISRRKPKDGTSPRGIFERSLWRIWTRSLFSRRREEGGGGGVGKEKSAILRTPFMRIYFKVRFCNRVFFVTEIATGRSFCAFEFAYLLSDKQIKKLS